MDKDIAEEHSNAWKEIRSGKENNQRIHRIYKTNRKITFIINF